MISGVKVSENNRLFEPSYVASPFRQRFFRALPSITRGYASCDLRPNDTPPFDTYHSYPARGIMLRHFDRARDHQWLEVHA